MPADEMEGLCRICVHESHYYKNIYESHIFDDTLFKIINELCQLSIQSGDGMPEFVCVDCYNKVLDFGRFKRTSHMGRVMLLGMKMRLRQAQRSIESAEVLANGGESVCSEETTGPVLMCIITQNGLEMTENNVVIKPEIIEGQETKEDFEQQIIISEAAMNNDCDKPGSMSSNLQLNMQEVDPSNWKPICENDISQAINAGNVYSIQQENAQNMTPKEDFPHNVYISKPGFKPEIWKPGNADGPHPCVSERGIAFESFTTAEGASNHIVYKDGTSNQVSLITNEHIPTVEMGLNHLVTEVNPSQVQLDMMVAGRTAIPSIIFLGSEPKISTKENSCSKCGTDFTDRTELEEHQKTECQTQTEDQYLCSNCGTRFGEKASLSEHLRLCHSESVRTDGAEDDDSMKLMSFTPKPDPNLECKYCGKVFTRSDHLNSHLKDHMEHLKDSIKYYCPGCNKAFVRQYYLTRHKRRCTVLN